tara:strand:+ start:17496 stop:18104 length:609 start_codon:yes stop_codon:yes gene_type:complete
MSVVFGSVIILVVGSGIFPRFKCFKVVREWQTLIGAVLGFGGVAVAILFQHNFELMRDEVEQKKYESNLLSAVSTELILINGELKNNVNQALEANKNFALDDMPRCSSIFRVLDQQKLRNISVSNNLQDLYGKISPETYSLVFQAVEARKMLDIVLDIPITERCEEFSASSAVNFYAEIIRDQLPFLEGLQSKIIKKAQSLR